MGLAHIATITDLVTAPYRANELAKGHMLARGIFLIRGVSGEKIRRNIAYQFFWRDCTKVDQLDYCALTGTTQYASS
jgi:hypothetical protein